MGETLPGGWKIDERPARSSWAPGQYLCQCSKCGDRFRGAKGARWCADCAYAEPEFLGSMPGDVVVQEYEEHKRNSNDEFKPDRTDVQYQYQGINQVIDKAELRMEEQTPTLQYKYQKLKQDADHIAERAHELSMLIRNAQDALRPKVHAARIEYTEVAAFEPIKTLVVPWDEYERMKAACKIIQEAKL